MLVSLSNSLHFRLSSFCLLFQTAMFKPIDNLLDSSTFANRLNNALILKNISRKELACRSNVALSTIKELCSGYRQKVKKETLIKLTDALDKDICDDYQFFVMNQSESLKKYSEKYLAKVCEVNRSTAERWKDGRYIMKKEYYDILKKD